MENITLGGMAMNRICSEVECVRILGDSIEHKPCLYIYGQPPPSVYSTMHSNMECVDMFVSLC